MRTRKQVGATAQLAPVAQKQLTLEGFSLYWLHGATKESVPSPSRRGWLGGRVSGAGDAKEPTFAAFDVISPLRVEAKLALNRMGVASQGAARIEAEVAVVGRAHVNVDCATMRDLSTLVCICGVCVRVRACACFGVCVCVNVCAHLHTRIITHTRAHTHTGGRSAGARDADATDARAPGCGVRQRTAPVVGLCHSGRHLMPQCLCVPS